jgi:hypothetical protein
MVMRTRYALVAVSAAVAVLLLAADLAPLRAGVDTPPLSVTVPGDQTSVIVGPGAGTNLTPGGALLQNTLVGYGAGGAIVGNTASTCVGYQACANFTGSGPNHALTAVGDQAAYSVTTPTDSIYIGPGAGADYDYSITTGPITGNDGIGIGAHALGHLGSGFGNLAIGTWNMVGCGNFIGFPSCPLLTGGGNTSTGNGSFGNIQGAAFWNTGDGYQNGTGLTTGTENIIDGALAANNLTTGSFNIAICVNCTLPSPTGNGQLNIGNLITGTGLTVGGAAANGALTINGSLAVASGITTTNNQLISNGAELDFMNTSGAVMAKSISNAGATGSYPVLQANGGPLAQIYASSGTLQVGVAGENVTVLGQKVSTASKTANYTVLTTDSGTSFDNIGATGAVIFSLPGAAAGLTYTFSNYAGQTLEVLGHGTDQIAVGGSNSASENITSSAAYASITIEAHGAGQWIASATPDKTQWTVH